MSFDVWRKAKLRDIEVTLIDCDHKTPVSVEEGYPYIAIPQLKNGHIQLEGVRKISHADWLTWTRKLKPQVHDVIVVRRCNSGQSAVVPKNLKCAIGQNLVVLRSSGTFVFPEFLRWLVQGDDWWEQVRTYLNVGAIFDSLKCKDIPNFELTIPPLEAQKEIALILDALDNRISLLRETNTTLEAIAQTLFKSWFVDFDPVKAKAEGRLPEGMDEATAALFPSEFEESALGLIPKGWRVGTIYEIANVLYGAPFKSAFFNEKGKGQPLIRIRDLESQEPKIFTDEVQPKGYLVNAGDCLVGMDGEFRPYLWTGQPAWLNQRVCAFLPQKNISTLFVREKLRPLLDFFERSKVGTTVIHLGRGDIDTFKVTIPNNDLICVYSDLVAPILDSIICNSQKSQTLTSLRDTLLPRLISGQLRLNQAQEIMDEVVA